MSTYNYVLRCDEASTPCSLAGRTHSWSHSSIPHSQIGFVLFRYSIGRPLASSPSPAYAGEREGMMMLDHQPRAVNQCIEERGGMRMIGTILPHKSSLRAEMVARTFSKLSSSTAFLVSFISIRRAFFCCSVLKRYQENKGSRGAEEGTYTTRALTVILFSSSLT